MAGENRKLAGKIAVVTGANSGMGMATAAVLSDMGAHVIMLCRSESRGKKAYMDLKLKNGRSLELIKCDLEIFSSIKRAADEIKSRYNFVDILVNNAGFISLDRQITQEGYEKQFGVNHLGHFLLTLELLDIMKSGGRIVNVASGAHKTGNIYFDDITLKKNFNVVTAYSQSKLANVLFTRELARRLKERRITVNCCHPGAVATNIGIDRKTGFGKTITGVLKPFFRTPKEGAATAIFLASSDDVKTITGGYFYDSKIAPSSHRSKDKELAKKLFEFSEKATGKYL